MKYLEKWPDEVHNSEEQKLRIEAAKHLDKCAINYVNKTGKFFNGKGVEDTTLDGCTCADFKARQKPCLHMYCLAAKLTNIEKPKNTDTNEIQNHIDKSSAGLFTGLAATLLVLGLVAGVILGDAFPSVKVTGTYYIDTEYTFNYVLMLSTWVSSGILCAIFYGFSLTLKELSKIYEIVNKLTNDKK